MTKIKSRRENKARAQWEAEHDWHAEQSANETKSAFEIYLNTAHKKKILDILIYGLVLLGAARCGVST